MSSNQNSMDAESQNVVFNPESKEWRCCCGCMHVRTGAIVIGILGVMFAMIHAIGGYHFHPLTVMVAMLEVIPVALLIYGAHKHNACMMLPHIILQIFGLVCLIAGAIAFFVLGGIAVNTARQAASLIDTLREPQQFDWLTRQTYDHTLEAAKTMVEATCRSGIILLVIGGSCLVNFAIQVWFTCVVCKAYKYVKAVQFAGYGKNLGPVVGVAALEAEKPPPYHY